MPEGPGAAPSLKLAGPGPQIAQVLETVGFDKYFEVHPDVETAVAAF